MGSSSLQKQIKSLQWFHRKAFRETRTGQFWQPNDLSKWKTHLDTYSCDVFPNDLFFGFPDLYPAPPIFDASEFTKVMFLDRSADKGDAYRTALRERVELPDIEAKLFDRQERVAKTTSDSTLLKWIHGTTLTTIPATIRARSDVTPQMINLALARRRYVEHRERVVKLSQLCETNYTRWLVGLTLPRCMSTENMDMYDPLTYTIPYSKWHQINRCMKTFILGSFCLQFVSVLSFEKQRGYAIDHAAILFTHLFSYMTSLDPQERDDIVVFRNDRITNLKGLYLDCVSGRIHRNPNVTKRKVRVSDRYNSDSQLFQQYAYCCAREGSEISLYHAALLKRLGASSLTTKDRARFEHLVHEARQIYSL